MTTDIEKLKSYKDQLAEHWHEADTNALRKALVMVLVDVGDRINKQFEEDNKEQTP